MNLINFAAIGIEAAGTLGLLGYILAALLALLRPHGLERSRLLLADGAVFALGFKTGASLLKTLEIGTWHQIGAFVAILALRTMLKRTFAAEKAALLRDRTAIGIVSPVRDRSAGRVGSLNPVHT